MRRWYSGSWKVLMGIAILCNIYTIYIYLIILVHTYNRITYLLNTYKYIHCCNILAQRMIYRGVTCHLSVEKQQYDLMVVQGMFQFFLNSITMAIMGHCRGSFAQSSIIWIIWLFIHVDLDPVTPSCPDCSEWHLIRWSATGAEQCEQCWRAFQRPWNLGKLRNLDDQCLVGYSRISIQVGTRIFRFRSQKDLYGEIFCW